MNSGTFSVLLRELVSDLMLAEQTGNQVSSVLGQPASGLSALPETRVLLGSWLADTDHRALEDVVSSRRSHQ